MPSFHSWRRLPLPVSCVSSQRCVSLQVHTHPVCICPFPPSLTVGICSGPCSASHWEVVSSRCICRCLTLSLFFKQMTSIPLYPWLMDSDVSLDITDSTGVSNLARTSFCTGFLSLRTVAIWCFLVGRGGPSVLGRLAASLSTVSAGCQEPRIPS